MKKNWAVFISGTGSNLNALLDSHDKVRLVVSSSSTAYGLLRAKRAGVLTYVLSKKIDWDMLLKTLESLSINRIFLAGFMKIVPESFIQKFKGQIVNLHPSLLPHYPGLHSIERAYADERPLGASVHHVIPEVDAGQIILQRKSESYSRLNESEFLVHLSEQRIVREVIAKC